MSGEPFIVFGAPQIEEEEIAEVVATMRSAWIGTGPRVASFERDFASYKSTSIERVAAVNSGTAALHLSLLASGVEAGDEVIVPAMTFCASVNAIIHAGATPVLADVETDSMNLDPIDVERRINANTKAIMPVHFSGRPCNMESLMTLAKRYDLKVIEDCAHAIETQYKGTGAGKFGDFGCFSFYVTKNLTTGEGGMVIARREEDIERIKMLALHGMSKDAWHRFSDTGYKHYFVAGAGFKYNMTDMQAAMGIHQLRRINVNLARRQSIWAQYDEAFKDLQITLPPVPEPDTLHARHLYTVLVDQTRTGISRDQFLTRMTKLNIGIGVHYLSIAEHPFYRKTYGFRNEDYPVSRKIGEQTVSLPLSAGLTRGQVERVVAAVRKSLAGRG